MDIAKAHHYFNSRFRCARGFDFLAQLLAAPIEPSSTYFITPRRILKLDAHSMVRPGDQVYSPASDKSWFCGENGPSEFQGRTIYKTLKLFEVTHTNVSWRGDTTATSNITGQKVKTANEEKGPIDVTIEFLKLQEDEMRIPADQVRIITNKNVRVGDRIGPYTVINAEAQIGLVFCTAKRQ